MVSRALNHVLKSPSSKPEILLQQAEEKHLRRRNQKQDREDDEEEESSEEDEDDDEEEGEEMDAEFDALEVSDTAYASTCVIIVRNSF